MKPFKTENKLRLLIKRAGGRYVGIQQALDRKDDLVLFDDPETKTTLAVKLNDIAIDIVKEKIIKSRAVFKKYSDKSVLLKIQKINTIAHTLLPHVCADKEGIKKLMLILYYLKTL